MTQEEIKALTDAVTKGGDTLTNYVKGLKATEPEIKLDGVKKFLEENDEGKTYLQSVADKRVTDGIETFKKNNLQNLVDEEYKKQHPEADPKDTEIAKLKKQFEDMQKENLKKDLTNKALKTMTEKKLPTDLVNFIVGADEDTTNKNLETLEKVFSTHDEAIKTEILKDGTYKPGGQGGAEPTEEAVKGQINSLFGIKE
ncbi:DUF4355 domain-containing protein [Clostridium sp. AWRP]|uniref:DUF4355 domain-containing protein n=1 Tax=Clostridium sp. AWRP TaxID=2212991 RepID=UPI000FDB9015|nr:DUF4355 domain-containing protein [Clostridium sp. AWRP]AZV58836.1 DUF4355 domain-containing protein [Clostridium sp. AWRP]